MKRTIKAIAAIAFSVFTLASCNRELAGVDNIEKTGYTINFIADIEDTKTTMSIDGSNVTYSWDADDENTEEWFSIWAGEQKASLVMAELTDDGRLSISATFDNPLPTSGKINFTGIMNGTVKDEQISFSDGGTDAKHFYDRESDVLTATASVSASQIDNGVFFNFKREVGINKMTIKGLPEGAIVEEVQISSDNNQLAGTYDLTNGWQDNADNTITVTCEEIVEDEDAGLVVYFVSRPLNSASLTINLTDDNGVSYTKTTAAAITLAAGNVKGYTIRVAQDVTDPHAEDDGWFLVHNAAYLHAGDLIRIAYNNVVGGAVATTDVNRYMASTTAVFSNDKEEMKSAGANVMDITLGGTKDAWTLSSGETLIGCSKADLNKDGEGITEWAISIDSNASAEISYVGTGDVIYRFKYNTSSPRFKPYEGDPTPQMPLPQIYKKYGTPADVDTYTVSVDSEVEGGTISADPTSAAAGAIITLTATPSDGYKFVSWTVLGTESRQPITVTSGKFEMPDEDVQVTATFSLLESHTLTNEEIVAAVGFTSNGYKDVTISSKSGDWDANANCSASQKCLQLRNNTTSHLTSPVFSDNISRVIIHMNSTGTVSRTLIALDPSFELPSSNNYSDSNIDVSKRYATAKTNGGEENITLEFTQNTKQFMLVPLGGAVYIDWIDVEFGDIPTVSVTGLTITPDSKTISVGKTTTLQATISPANATNKNVTWDSEDKTIATVDNNGVVTGVKAGSVRISATTEDGDITAYAAISVEEAAPVLTTIAQIKAALKTGTSDNKVKFTANLENSAVVTYANGKSVFVDDGTAAIMLFVTNSYKVGDTLSSSWSGEGYDFNGFVEISSFENMPSASAGTAPTIPIATISQIKGNSDYYDSRIVKIEGISVTDGISTTGSTGDQNGTIAQGEQTMPVYSKAYGSATITMNKDEEGDLICIPYTYSETQTLSVWQQDHFIKNSTGGDDDDTGDYVYPHTVYNFSAISGLSGWGTTYQEHIVTYDNGTVTFASANKNTSTITDVPVTKGGEVTLVMKDNNRIKSLKFTCSQWESKTQTITLRTSTDGETFTATNITSSNFVLSADELGDNIKAVKFTFSSSKNQVGIVSLEINGGEGGDTPDPTPVDATWKVEPTSVSVDEGANATVTITTNYDGTLAVASNSSATATASISGKTITVHGVKAGTTTLTVTGAATSSYKAISKTINVTVNSVSSSAWDHTFTSGEIKVGNATISGLTFNWSQTGAAPNYDTTRGLGFSKANGTLTVSGFSAGITKVTLVMSANDSATASVKIGDSSSYEDKTVASGAANNNTEYVWTVNGNGTIYIKLSSTKSVWIKSMKIN